MRKKGKRAGRQLLLRKYETWVRHTRTKTGGCCLNIRKRILDRGEASTDGQEGLEFLLIAKNPINSKMYAPWNKEGPQPNRLGKRGKVSEEDLDSSNETR